MNRPTAAPSAPLTPPEDPAFLKAVTELAKRRPVVTSRAIHNLQGIKLLEGGVVIDEGLYERLLSHRLSRPLDESLNGGTAMTGAALVEAAEAAMARWPFFALMGQSGRVRSMLLEAIKAIPLPAPVVFHLTLARETRASLFDHCILMALLCAHLVREGGAPIQDITMAAAAGLLHDLGMLHIDADLLEAGNRLNGDERRPLYVHPVTSSMLIARFHEYPKQVPRAILEHHEMLDGSGYPRGLAGQGISPLGRLLSLAEVVTAMFDGERQYPEQRVSLLLRMNPKRYDESLVPSIHRLLGALPQATEAPGVDAAEVVDRLGLHAGLLDQWREVVAVVLPQADGDAAVLLESVSEQAETLQRVLFEAGITAGQLGMFTEGAPLSPGLTVDLWALAQELQWNLRATANQLQRRWRSGGGGRPIPSELGLWLDDVNALDLHS